MSDVERDLAASAARLYYMDGKGQHEIALILGVSRPKISRLLALARELGIVRISVEPYEPRDSSLEGRLQDRFGLRHVVVVKALGHSPESVRHAVGHYAAPIIAKQLRPGMTVGVAGGRTLGELIHSLAPSNQRSGIHVLQLMGHIDPTARHMDAPELGRILAGRAGGTFSTLTAPAFTSDEETRAAFLSQVQIGRIYEEFDNLDLALVGIGMMHDSVFAERGALNHNDYARLESHGAVGEICGRFFDQEGRECASIYRNRVVSIDLDQLGRVPEVIAVTNGANRTAAVLAAIRGGLINSIVIDHLGASALLRASEAPAWAAGTTTMTPA